MFSVEKTCLESTLGDLATDRVWSAAVVLQGPHMGIHTQRTVQIFLERNISSVLLVVATYRPDSERFVGDFLSDFEKEIVLEKKGPHVGRLIYLFVRTPTPEEAPDFWRTNQMNQNRQRLTTFVGLRFVDGLGIRLSLKCRTDAFLGRRDVCRYLNDKFLEKFPITERPCGPRAVGDKLRKRMVICENTQIQSDRPQLQIGNSYISDFWFFGETRDLLIYFDIRETSGWNNGSGMCAINISPEANMAVDWMKAVGIAQDVFTPELLARYFAVADTVDVEFIWQKHWHFNYEYYLINGRAEAAKGQKLERAWLPSGTHERWLGFVEEYAIRDAKEIASRQLSHV